MTEEIFNIKQACEFLGIKERTMYKLINSGKIPAIKIGGQWRFAKQVLIDMFHHPSDNMGIYKNK